VRERALFSLSRCHITHRILVGGEDHAVVVVRTFALEGQTMDWMDGWRAGRVDERMDWTED
jgi:hypothetical protein